MMRKMAQSALLFLMLSCLMGATINFDAGQPKVLPAGMPGMPSTLQGKGTYAAGPNETMTNFMFYASNTKTLQITGTTQTWGNNTWDSSVTPGSGNFDVTASIDAFNMMTMTTVTVRTITVNVN